MFSRLIFFNWIDDATKSLFIKGKIISASKCNYFDDLINMFAISIEKKLEISEI